MRITSMETCKVFLHHDCVPLKVITAVIVSRLRCKSCISYMKMIIFSGFSYIVSDIYCHGLPESDNFALFAYVLCDIPVLRIS